MRKKDIPILVALFALLFLWQPLVSTVWKKVAPPPPPPPPEVAGEAAGDSASTNAVITAGPADSTNAALPDIAAVKPATPADAAPAPTNAATQAAVPAEPSFHASDKPILVSLSNELTTITMSSWGAGISSVELHKFPRFNRADSGNLTLDFGGSPALAFDGIAGLSTNYDFDVAVESNRLTATRTTGDGLFFRRTVEPDGAYNFKVTDEFVNTTTAPMALDKHGMSVGPMRNLENETAVRGLIYLGIDSQAAHGGEDTRHWGMGGGLHGEPTLVQHFLPEHLRSGCSWFKPPMAKWMDERMEAEWKKDTDWLAVKNKFFVQVLSTAEDAPGSSFTMRAAREVIPPALRGLSGPAKLKNLDLSGAEITVGRGESNKLVLDHPSVASNHCRLVREGYDYAVVCDTSGGRVMVNGKPETRKLLEPGDVVKIGEVELAYVGGEHPDRRETWAKAPMLSEVSAVMNHDGFELKPGQSSVRKTSYYAGPKKYGILKALGRDTVMEFGFWTPMCKLVLVVLNGIHWVAPNYGIAIILLTILIRLLFWPVMKKSTDTMKKMSELQPKLKELKEQYGNDQQKFLQKQQELFKQHKVSPLGGCLPMLIQLPVLFSLFIVLRSAVELRFAGFLWISDLSEPEGLLAGMIPFWPYQLNILPLVMTAATIWQQKLTPAGGDAQQQKIMAIMMPLMFLLMFYNMASALVLYWTVSTLAGIVDLLLRKRRDAAKAAEQRA